METYRPGLRTPKAFPADIPIPFPTNSIGVHINALIVLLSVSPFASAESPNDSCPYLNENIRYAARTKDGIPAFKATDQLWRKDGHLNLAAKAFNLDEPAMQSGVFQGQGVPFASPTGLFNNTEIRLRFHTDGRVTKLMQNDVHKRPPGQELNFSWSGDHCVLEKVLVGSTDIGIDKVGVSYDKGLCESLDKKCLLDEKRARDCTNFAEKTSDVIGDYAKHLPAHEAEALGMVMTKPEVLTLFTTAPSGTTKLKEWKPESVLSTAILVQDCVY